MSRCENCFWADGSVVFSFDLCDINVISVKQSANTTRKQAAKIHFADCCTIIWVKYCRHVFHLVITPVPTLVLPYAELRSMQSRLQVYSCAAHHLSLQDINAQLEIWWYLGGLSWLMYGSRTHSVSGCLWGNLSLSPQACNHFHRLTSHIVFSTWRCIIQWPAAFRIRSAHASAHVRVRESRHFAGTSHSCWQERGMIAPHQHAINPQAVCLSHVASGNADAAVMSPIWFAKMWSLSLLIACFLALQQWCEKLLKHTDKFYTCAQSLLYSAPVWLVVRV